MSVEQPIREIEQALREDGVMQLAFRPANREDGVDMMLQGPGRRQCQDAGTVQQWLERCIDRGIVEIAEQCVDE